MALPYIFRIPRPKTVLGFISLRSATELITFILLINKVTGLYGILALFTGYSLNPLQFSLYLYSVVVLGLGAWLASDLRNPAQPMKVLGLSWLYVIDTVINSVYTSLFGASWFIVLAQHLDDTTQQPGSNAPGGDTINDTAGFTSPEFNVSHVDVVVTPASGLMTGQDAVAIGSNYGDLGNAVFQRGSIASMTIICLLWVVRFYFCLIVMSYARGMVRQYVLMTSNTYSRTEDPSLAENPFREGREEGQGWRGQVGRFMLRFPTKRYWLGKDDGEDEWVRATSGRFARNKDLRIKVPAPGVGERERRARSGTGPPPPLASKDGQLTS